MIPSALSAVRIQNLWILQSESVEGKDPADTVLMYFSQSPRHLFTTKGHACLALCCPHHVNCLEWGGVGDGKIVYNLRNIFSAFFFTLKGWSLLLRNHIKKGSHVQSLKFNRLTIIAAKI